MSIICNTRRGQNCVLTCIHFRKEKISLTSTAACCAAETHDYGGARRVLAEIYNYLLVRLTGCSEVRSVTEASTTPKFSYPSWCPVFIAFLIKMIFSVHSIAGSRFQISMSIVANLLMIFSLYQDDFWLKSHIRSAANTWQEGRWVFKLRILLYECWVLTTSRKLPGAQWQESTATFDFPSSSSESVHYLWKILLSSHVFVFFRGLLVVFFL